MSIFRSSAAARWLKRSDQAMPARDEPESMAVARKAGAEVRRHRPRHVGRLLAAAACLLTAVGALVVASPSIEAATLDGVVAAEGGPTPYKWKITSGALPQGIKLDKSTGVISGTVKIKRRNEPATGPYTFTVTATDHGRGKQTSAPVNLTLTLDPA